MLVLARDMQFKGVTVPKGTQTRLATPKEVKDFIHSFPSAKECKVALEREGWKLVFLSGQFRWAEREDLKEMKSKPMGKVVEATERAMRELDLTLTTQADKARWWRVWQGLQALDSEQATIKNTIEDLLEGYEQSKNVKALITGLKKIVE